MMRPEFKDRIPRPRGIFPTLPSGIDRRMKERFDSHRRKGTLPPELQQFKGAELFANESLLREWQNNRKGLRYESPNGNTVAGALDDLLIDADGRRIPVDGKSRGFPPKSEHLKLYKPQLGIYNFLLHQNGHEIANKGILVYYWPIDVSERVLIEQVSTHDARMLNGSAALNLDVLEFDAECRADQEPKSRQTCMGLVFAYEVHVVEVSIKETMALLKRANTIARAKNPPEANNDCEHCDFARRRAEFTVATD